MLVNDFPEGRILFQLLKFPLLIAAGLRIKPEKQQHPQDWDLISNFVEGKKNVMNVLR